MILHDLWSAFLAFANCLSRDRSPDDQQESAGRDTKHDERPELMIIRLSAKGTFFCAAINTFGPGNHSDANDDNRIDFKISYILECLTQALPYFPPEVEGAAHREAAGVFMKP